MKRTKEDRLAMAEAFMDSCESMACIMNYLGQYLACNEAFTAALGWDEQELRDMTFFDIVPPSEHAWVREIGTALLQNTKSARQSYAHSIRHKDGSCRHVHWTVWGDASKRLIFASGQVEPCSQVESSAPSSPAEVT
jgi:PAS domain S-box-containing protein